jgi:hypothetical protein
VARGLPSPAVAGSDPVRVWEGTLSTTARRRKPYGWPTQDPDLGRHHMIARRRHAHSRVRVARWWVVTRRHRPSGPTGHAALARSFSFEWRQRWRRKKLLGLRGNRDARWFHSCKNRSPPSIADERRSALWTELGPCGCVKSGPRPSLPYVILRTGWAGPDLASGPVTV